ncbi:MAG: coagulation factor 5/8 type domain protein [Clostridia bacterium]|jgi:type II secretory pathway pseudopilin PulG|nr:coagulation factor 5/8 type domain protein [Clostridia bacterium]
MNKKKESGISLIILIITMIVIIILAGAVILIVTNSGILDRAKKARFMSDFRSVEEGVNLYSLSNLANSQNSSNLNLPVEVNKLTFAEKDEIVFNVPTLKEKIEKLNPGQTIYDRDLYWINESDAGVTLSKEKQEKGYIIDGNTKQIYDYNGDVFEKLRWHTLDSGVDEASVVRQPATDELANGWIRLTLYYPNNSTEKKWRLGNEGEMRADPMLMWQEYTGSITIPLYRMKDVWIKYKVNNKEVTVPPAGTLLVDIIPDKTGSTKVEEVNVSINYDETATIKEFRIGDSGWLTYTGPFKVTENCIIEARAKKAEDIYNTDGSLLLTRDIAGSDMVYVGNIGVETESILPAPTITRLAPQSADEKARVKITYPSSAANKVYILNSGGEIQYSSEISVSNWDTYIVAYYYDSTGKKSKEISITINDTSTGNPPEEPEIINVLSAPIITRLAAQSADEKAKVQITYPENAEKKIYTVDFGIEVEYTSDISIKNWGTTIVAYYYDKSGKKSDSVKIEINDTTTGDKPKLPESDTVKIQVVEPAPTMTRLSARSADEKAGIKVDYPANASRKMYKVNYGIEQVYTGEISIKNWGTNVIAYYYDVDGNMSKITSLTINNTSVEPEEQPKPFEPLPPYEPKTPLPPSTIDIDVNLLAPIITRLAPQDSTEKARVNVVYPGVAVRKVFTVNSGAEIEYTGNIKINGWNTTINAYYYDAKGNKSKLAKIFIGEEPTPPTEPVIYEPKSVVAAPVINISPITGIVNQVTLSVTPKVAADKIYLKIGEYADYIEYTGPVIVKENAEVYAYYTVFTGEKSLTAKANITNIKQGNKPYLNISANPYPWPNAKGVKEVNITLNTSDANKVEYSEDGVVYKNYTAPFIVTENKRIYARATNTYGVTESYLDITNIGVGETVPPEPILKLSVNINADPDPLISQTRVGKVVVSIEYDQRATEKYYSIGKSGELKPYTEPFEVTNNSTIYAYAIGTNAKGEATKTIDNILTGISEPIISTIPVSSVIASKVKVNIVYDKYSTIKKYSINGGVLQNYTGEFEVTENGTRIYAYSENAANQKSEANYVIQNIIPDPPVLLLDKGSYYLLKLNYPEDSKIKEYKWKVNGEWKTYKDDGLLLIKPQYKDTIIKSGTLIKIEDENGNKIDFKGDYYLLDVSIRELFENVFMRWDRVPPKAPQISINTTEPIKQVSVTIIYENGLIKRQYRLLEPGGTLGEWNAYTDPISITKNNTIIYARGMDDTEVWSAEGIYKVINIDEIQPVIRLTADLTNAMQKIPILVSVTDDIAIGKIKWATGAVGESYFINSGTEIQNDSTVEIATNGIYTFYAEDRVGNIQTYSLNVTNIDLTPPAINISVVPESTVGITADITIDYGDSVTKQYKIGENNNTWTNYSSTITLSSYTAITNNWKNADGTLTIFAKGKDKAGNEVITQKRIISLDLDMPTAPIINSQSGYPVISSYGIKFDSGTTVTYANRADIDNYYSVNNGTTWELYTGSFNIASGTVLAKSVKKISGLSISVSKTIVTPSDSIKSQAYDNNNTTAIVGSANQYMLVDGSMINQQIRVNCSLDSYNFGNAGVYTAYASLRFLDVNKQLISSVSLNGDKTYTIPLNTKWIQYIGSSNNYGGYNIDPRLYEIQTLNDPTFTASSVYMLLTYYQTDAIRNPYQMVTVSYHPTSVQKLYRIGTTGEWLNYQGQPVQVLQGQTVYAKGIDQYGIETRIVATYTCNITDALTNEAYDMNSSTNIGTTYINEVITKSIAVDPSMIGNQVKLICNASSSGGRNSSVVLTFMNSSNQEISSIYKASYFDGLVTIPANTKMIKFTITASYYTYAERSYPLLAYLYDIYPSNW